MFNESHLSGAQALIESSPTLQSLTDIFVTKLFGEEGSRNRDTAAKGREISSHVVRSFKQ
jgi:hypothetical protein